MTSVPGGTSKLSSRVTRPCSVEEATGFGGAGDWLEASGTRENTTTERTKAWMSLVFRRFIDRRPEWSPDSSPF